MVAPLTKPDFIRLRDLLLQSCGIYLEDDKDYLVETRLASMADELGCKNFFELYSRIVRESQQLLPKLIDLMTTNETYWFRDDSLWAMMEQHLIPELLERLSKGQKNSVRIWSAACSTGQEVYSLKILFDEIARRKGLTHYLKSISFLATDISSTVLFLAKSGRYNSMSLSRGLSEPRKQAYFEKIGETVWKIKDELKENISFERFNLMDQFSSYGKFDMILCRNVLIYFSIDCKKELLKKFHASLGVDGIFLLGASESIFNYSNDFETKEFGRGVCYRPKV